jgi:hypothetical protein
VLAAIVLAAALWALGSASADPAAAAPHARRPPARHVLYPSPARLRAATRFLQRRAGRKPFAVIDDAGRLHGYRVHSRSTASRETRTWSTTDPAAARGD